MNTIEKKVDALVKLSLCENPKERESILKSLREMLVKSESAPVDYQGKAKKALLELGTPDHIKGHAYLIHAIVMVIENPECIEQVTSVLYPEVAKKFNTTASRVERAIRHAVEVTWERADLEAVLKYFGGTVHPARGKPTNSEFLARMANELR